MRILPRLRYILEVCTPAAPTVNDTLDILTRISQHSTQAASEVLKCPRLMETIFANFLPLSWKRINVSSGTVCGQPMSLAMRLVRALCCAGRQKAVVLVSCYQICSVKICCKVHLNAVSSYEVQSAGHRH